MLQVETAAGSGTLPTDAHMDSRINGHVGPNELHSVSTAKVTESANVVNQSRKILAGLYTERHAAKIWRVAQRFLKNDPTLAEYPEHVPIDGENAGRYQTKPCQFWTCGFFPGSMYALLERSMKYPQSLPIAPSVKAEFQSQLLELCRSWTGPLHKNALRTNTHDLGFIVQPALRMDWELTGNRESLNSVITAARNLSSRWGDKVGAIRSWNLQKNHAWEITDMETNFLIIVDSMCNMDLLFYAGHHTGDQTLIDRATSHAHVVLRTLIRDDWSTFHVVNLDPNSGAIKHQQTHQGYSDSSCWSRGQGWAILGFTQTYIWTKDPVFLNAAVRLAEHFLNRLSRANHAHPNVPAWDFDAPTVPGAPVLRDTSAGMIAANGMLLLHQILRGNSPYLEAVMRIIDDTLAYTLSQDEAKLEMDADKRIFVKEGKFDAILEHATANNHEHAVVRYSDHGLVYADYYFLELGNKLLRMGLV